MQLMKLGIPALIIGAGCLLCVSSVYGTPEYAKKEKKACAYCHQKVVSNKEDMTKNLTSKGTCYKDGEHSLAKCSSSR